MKELMLLRICEKDNYVVKCLGLVRDKKSNLYAIVLEKMDMDLESVLKRNWSDLLDYSRRVEQKLFIAQVPFTPFFSLILFLLFKCIAKGMAYLHSYNVLHLDLKTSNILCNLTNNVVDEVKISDLGLGLLKTSEIHTLSTRYVYKPIQPPWQENLSKKTDVYAFGLLVRKMFPQTDFQPIQELIDRCLTRTPAERPSFDELKVIISDIKCYGDLNMLNDEEALYVQDSVGRMPQPKKENQAEWTESYIEDSVAI